MRSAALIAVALASSPAAALVPLYSAPHHYNDTSYSFIANQSGELKAWFGGSEAAFDNRLGLKINGVDTGIRGLGNKHSSIGDFLSFGNVNTGDLLNFFISVGDTKKEFYSNRDDNEDGINHVYASDFTGDDALPQGTYLGFEDKFGGGDKDYNDATFIFNISPPEGGRLESAVPEPAAWAMMLTGFGLVGMALRRRFAKGRTDVVESTAS